MTEHSPSSLSDEGLVEILTAFLLSYADRLDLDASTVLTWDGVFVERESNSVTITALLTHRCPPISLPPVVNEGLMVSAAVSGHAAMVEFEVVRGSRAQSPEPLIDSDLAHLPHPDPSVAMAFLEQALWAFGEYEISSMFPVGEDEWQASTPVGEMLSERMKSLPRGVVVAITNVPDDVVFDLFAFVEAFEWDGFRAVHFENPARATSSDGVVGNLFFLAVA